MNNQYFAIISRDEFLKLYRFGIIKVSFAYIVDKDVFAKKRIEKILSNMSFEHEEGYLVLEFEDTKLDDDYEFGKISILYELNLKTIKAIYALSEKAQNFYSTKFNPKIKFSILPFTEVLNNVLENKEFEDMGKGVDVLFEQFAIPNKEGTEKNIGNDFKKRLFDYLKTDNYLDKSYDNFYFDLLSYKRENKFTKNDVGFIYDLIMIAILKERDIDKISIFKQGELNLHKSKSFQIFEENPQESLIQYIKFMKNTIDENVVKFIDKLGMENIIIGIIFLKTRSILDQEHGKKHGYQEELKMLIDGFKIDYEKELGIAIYLVGLIFGYKNLYDDYYDYLYLDVFKDITLTDDAKLGYTSQDSVKTEKYELSQKLERENNPDFNIELKNCVLNSFLDGLNIPSLVEIYFKDCNVKGKERKKDIKGYSKPQLIDKILSSYIEKEKIERYRLFT